MLSIWVIYIKSHMLCNVIIKEFSYNISSCMKLEDWLPRNSHSFFISSLSLNAIMKPQGTTRSLPTSHYFLQHYRNKTLYWYEKIVFGPFCEDFDKHIKVDVNVVKDRVMYNKINHPQTSQNNGTPFSKVGIRTRPQMS